jgi:hypothetical protein
MVNELITQYQIFQQKWQKLLSASAHPEFYAALKPIAVGWKVASIADFDAAVPELRAISDRVHFSLLDERWLGAFHLKDSLLPDDIRHIKVMQRRPTKPNDTLGLDHVDFLLPDGIDIEALLHDEAFSWEREKGDLCEWISIRFDSTEAKLRFHEQTSLDAVIKEWRIIRENVVGE